MIIGIYIILLILISLMTVAVVYAMILYKRAVDLNPERETRDSLIQQIEARKKELAQKNNEYDAMRAKIEAGNDIIAKAENDKKWLEAHDSEIQNKKKSEADLNEKINDLTDKYAKKTAEKANLDNEIKKISGEKKSLEDLVDGLKRDKRNLEEDIKSLDSKRKTISAVVSQLESKKAQLEAEKDRCKQELDALQLEKKKLDLDVPRLRQEYAGLQENIERNSVKQAELETDVKALSRGVEVSKEKMWKDLEKDDGLPNIKFRSGGKAYAERVWLANFKKNLEDSGIVFHDRVVNAFHTCLKIADASPLLVLAGISGTGKSLLPELYARAIGMNFLQVAVQPRWDSPQDMFGFYDYMTARFKATELSRLLWLNDNWNNGTVAKNHPGMNLVLLDEMNLARVEYYFSDMLSKLETRRGLNPKDADARRAAEVVLDCGFGEDAVRRIFVGNNTLFVGTMNEDESTQMLSDKVVDRSNIIRFGKPKNVGAKPDKGKFFGLCAEVNAMRSEDWGKEIHDPDDQVVDLLNEINGEMEKLGRPFAIRTAYSVRSYIANYPKGTVDGISAEKAALSDQVEMKILPKLNGVDKQDAQVVDALNKLSNKLEGKIDDGLSKAFDDAIKKEEPFFRWLGVSR